MQPLNQQLLDTSAQIAERERLARALERVDAGLKTERKNLADLESSFRKEDADVRQLENASLVGLIFTILGRKETRLEQERDELLAAKLKYDQCKRRVEALERDGADLRARLAGGEGLQDRYQRLLSEKESLLRHEPGETGRHLSDLADQLAAAQREERELQEAVLAGKSAEAGLRHAVETLESASGWGTWDLLGGGMLASAVKHAKLDEAHHAVQEVQPLLQRFDRELADVDGAASLNISQDGLAAFADIFIDNLLFDLLVQSRISESLEAARGMFERVSELVSRLSERYDRARERTQHIEADRRSAVEQAPGTAG